MFLPLRGRKGQMWSWAPDRVQEVVSYRAVVVPPFPVSGHALAFGNLRGSRRIDSAFCTWIKWSVVVTPFPVSGHALAFGNLRGSRRIGSASCLCGSLEWRQRWKWSSDQKKRRHVIADALIAEGYIVSVPKIALTVISILIVRMFSPQVRWGWSPPKMALDVTQRLTELYESDRYVIERWRRCNPFPVSGHALAFGNLRGSRRIDFAFCTWIKFVRD